jgi:hypothetical protein
MTDKNTDNVAVQEATAKAQAEARMKDNSGYNALYIVTVEDPTVKAKSRKFASPKPPLEAAFYVDVTGIEIVTKKAYKSYKEVLDDVKGETVKMVNIKFPWTKVIHIDNRTYQTKTR